MSKLFSGNKKILLALLASIFCIRNSNAQDVNLASQNIDMDKFKNIKGQLKNQFKSKAFKINGGFSVNSVYTLYNAHTAAGMPPLTYIANGNIRLSLYNKLSIPVSFTYANKKFAYAYTTPNYRINRLALRTHYKKWTLGAGDITMAFSPYTLGSMLFTGGSVEYAPSKIKIQGLYGRFLKAVAEDTTARKPSYKRMGWGIKTAYQHQNKKLALSLFHAKDEASSIPLPTKENNGSIRPMEGTAFAVEAGWPLLKRLTIEAAVSSSILTHDLLYQGKDPAKTSVLKKAVGVNNASTQVYYAVKTGIQYTIQQSSIGVNYERVDPNYQSIGTYYCTNDFENITMHIAQNLGKNKINIGIDAGLQRDDLAGIKQTRMRRVVLGTNVGWRPGTRLNVTGNYSSFQSYTFIQPELSKIIQETPYENLDTLNVTQLSQNAGLNLVYQLSKQKQQPQLLAVTINFMNAANKRGDTVVNGAVTRVLTGNVNHTLTLTSKEFNVNTGFMYSQNYGALQRITTWGPSVNISKAFFKKVMQVNGGTMYNAVEGYEAANRILTIRGSATAAIRKKHHLTATVQWQKRVTRVQTNTVFTANVGYNFSL